MAKIVHEEGEGYSHALLASTARTYVDRALDGSEVQPNQFALGGMVMAAFALEAYFNLIAAELDERGKIPSVFDWEVFQRSKPKEKYLCLMDALEAMHLSTVEPDEIEELFAFRNKVVHAKPYKREGQKKWKGERPMTPVTDPPWAREARPDKAKCFVDRMEVVIELMNKRVAAMMGRDFPIGVFGRASQVY